MCIALPNLIFTLIAILVSGGAFCAFAADATNPSPGTSAFLEESSHLEGEIATLLVSRTQLSGAQLTILDFQIDTRIIARWLIRRAADAEDQDALRACAWLRAAEVQTAAGQLNDRISNATRTLTSTQLDGLARLHQQTYKLTEIKTVSAMDESCRAIALDLILVADPTPADTQNLPPMRPLAGRAVAAGKQIVTPTDYVTRIKSLAVSESLRRELTEILNASVDPKQQQDAAGLRDALKLGVGLAESLGHGTGIDPMARSRIEQQLADALALYGDVRTRPAGRARLAPLEQISQSLAGVQQLSMPAAMQEKLGPALVWAARNPDHGADAIKLIESYLQLSARFDVGKDLTTLPVNQRRAIEPIQHRFAGEQTRFIQQIGSLDASSATSALAGLESHIKQLRELLDQMEALQQLPRAIGILTAYKPRPAGALERRGNLLMTELGGTNTANHDQTMRVVVDIARLARLAETLAADSIPARQVPPDVVKEYTQNLLSAEEAHRVVLIGELATQLAANKTPDRADFNRLQNLQALLASLPQAAQLEAALAKVDTLNRWADWSIPATRLRAMFAPYRQATVAAFDAFAVDNGLPIERWLDAHKTYEPLIAFVVGDAGYADVCAKLPAGLFGELSKLLTPMNAQPFETERYASQAAGVWAHYSATSDTRSADAVLYALSARLKDEQDTK